MGPLRQNSRILHEHFDRRFFFKLIFEHFKGVQILIIGTDELYSGYHADDWGTILVRLYRCPHAQYHTG